MTDFSLAFADFLEELARNGLGVFVIHTNLFNVCGRAGSAAMIS
jgi:hypothetical protein